MSSKCLLTVIFFFSPFNLFAQQFVDVFPDSVYIQERNDFNGSGIIKINYDSSVERFLPPTLPKGFSLSSMILGIRPKIRLDNFWISDGRKIYKKPLDAELGHEWELVKLPDHIAQFCDFEIISDKEAIICGCMFNWPDKIVSTLKLKSTNLNTRILNNLPSMMPRLYMHFIFNYKTGVVTTPIESNDLEANPYVLGDVRNGFFARKISESYMCRFDPKIIIVGKYSGLVTVLDLKDGKLSKFRKFVIVPEDEIPGDPKEAANNGSAIDWIGPLSGDDVLICCRMWVVPDKNPSEPVSVHCFRTLNLKAGKVTFEGSAYRDRMPESHLTLYEETGELLSARDVINKRLKQIEQAKLEQTKKTESATAPEQPEKQIDQPPKHSKQST